MNRETNVVIWKNSSPSGTFSVHVLNVDGTNTFTYNATSSDIFIQIRQAGTYYLDNIRMYRTYEDTIFVSGYEVEMAYRYGFNSMERDNEIKGKGNSYDFGARMYDPRVGRWLSLDPYSKKYPSFSNYVFVRNSPLIFIDPDGNTDFYFNGKYVGTDGVDNGLIGLVKTKDVKKDIKKGNHSFLLEPTQGDYDSYVIIDKNILNTSNEILKKSLTEGQEKEFGAVMKEGEDGLYEVSENGVVEGATVPLDTEGKTGSVDFEDYEEGDITIHSHRTGMSETGITASSDAPSLTDQEGVKRDKLSIIVGKKGRAVERDGGVIQDNRDKKGSIEFYKRTPAKSSYSLSGRDADRIIKHQNKKK